MLDFNTGAALCSGKTAALLLEGQMFYYEKRPIYFKDKAMPWPMMTLHMCKLGEIVIPNVGLG